MMQKNCTVKGCINEGKYCRIHPSGELKEQKPIKQRSKKLDRVMKKEYVPGVKSPVCTGRAQGFHHLAGRLGKLLTDKKKKIPCCNACNTFIEKNDAWARANGFKLSKFSEPITKRTA